MAMMVMELMPNTLLLINLTKSLFGELVTLSQMAFCTAGTCRATTAPVATATTAAASASNTLSHRFIGCTLLLTYKNNECG